MAATSHESLKSQVKLLVSSAKKGNATAVKSLLLWTRADPRAPHVISERQLEALEALRDLASKTLGLDLHHTELTVLMEVPQLSIRLHSRSAKIRFKTNT